MMFPCCMTMRQVFLPPEMWNSQVGLVRWKSKTLICCIARPNCPTLRTSLKFFADLNCDYPFLYFIWAQHPNLVTHFWSNFYIKIIYKCKVLLKYSRLQASVKLSWLFLHALHMTNCGCHWPWSKWNYSLHSNIDLAHSRFSYCQQVKTLTSTSYPTNVESSPNVTRYRFTIV